jgi:hypothetical protein
VELSYGQLEAALIMHFRIHPDRASAFRARIKQLAQRYQFPAGANVGRGEKMRYSTTHLFQLVAAFELINAGLNAGSAVETVASKWHNFACGFGLAVRHRKQKALSNIVYIRLVDVALISLQGHRNNAKIPAVFVEDEQSLARILKRNDDRLANAYLIVCATDVVLSVLDCVRRAAQIESPLAKIDADDWQIDGSDDDAEWMRAESGWCNKPLPALLPDFLGQVALNLIEDHRETAVKFLRDEADKVELTESDRAVLKGLGLLRGESGDEQLNDRGRAVASFLKKEG